MGQLLDGKWIVNAVNSDSENGEFKRKPMSFRSTNISPESGRYHLYVSYACPWAHRTLIFRKLKELEDHISVSVVHPLMTDDGWSFDQNYEGATGDDLFQKNFLREIYTQAKSDFTGRVTVPILWDKKEGTIVNNESSEVIRLLNSGFNELTGNKDDYYPENLRAEIDEINDLIYDNINNGVYKSGFATTQEAYEKAVTALFKTLDQLEERLEGKDYLVGNQLTEADLRLFPTLIRFDAVYVGHFKCNIRRIIDYPNLFAFTKRIYDLPEVAETVNLDHIKYHYYASHTSINPTGVVPVGPKSIWER